MPAADEAPASRPSEPQHSPGGPPRGLPSFLLEPPWRRSAQERPSLKLRPRLPPPSVHLSDEEAELGRKTAEAAQDRGRSENELSQPEAILRWLIDADAKELEALMKEELPHRWYFPGSLQALGCGIGFARPELAPEALWAIRAADETLTLARTTIRSAKAATYFLGTLGKKTVAVHGRSWAERHPDFAARAWLPVALGSTKSRGLAEVGLRHIAATKGVAVVREAAQAYGDAALAAIEPLLQTARQEDWPHPPDKLDFVDPTALPRPRPKGHELALSLEATRHLVEALAASTPGRVFPGLAEAKQQLREEDLSKLVWAVFEMWMNAGAPAQHPWPLHGLGWLGGDEVAHRLAPLVRAWPGESQHKRAVAGLDALLDIGSEVALMHLSSIAQGVKYPALEVEAQRRIETLAASLGLGPDALADRLAPTLGLDAEGGLDLDYGPRQFRVGFDESLKPIVLDARGKRLKSLPRPGAKDDPELAPAAAARFKALVKTLGALSALQIRRLESAMIFGRRWSAGDFRTFLVEHPLLVHLARRLVWASYDGLRLVRCFRVAEDRSFADREDETMALDVPWVGLPHPAELEETELRTWGTLFADYAIAQPFLQLGRSVHRPDPSEAEATRLTRNAGSLVASPRLLGLLGRGWTRGEALDSGVVRDLVHPLPGGTHELSLQLGGVGLWPAAHAQPEEPTFEGLRIRPLRADAAPLRFGDLPPGLWSELIDLLESLV